MTHNHEKMLLSAILTQMDRVGRNVLHCQTGTFAYPLKDICEFMAF